MKSSNADLGNKSEQETLWASKAIMIRESFGELYGKMGLFEKIIIPASMILPIYNLMIYGVDFKFSILLSVILVSGGTIVLVKRYMIKQRFENSNYVVTKDQIQITNRSLLGGNTISKIDLKSITKTYLLGGFRALKVWLALQ